MLSRRNVLASTLAVAGSSVAVAAVEKPETEFECASFTDERHPDDHNLWPEPWRAATQSAVDRLLKQYPNAKVVADISHCMDHTHARFPDNPGRPELKFALVRTISLDHG